MAKRCTHLGGIRDVTPSAPGCEECLQSGSVWLHLRICRSCGHVGCCDDSPNRHASAHAASSDHPIIRSLEPGERWSWCYIDEVALNIPAVRGETRIPPSPLGG
jgi:Zn-finger in ubiquitin-hydrolases and other protein